MQPIQPFSPSRRPDEDRSFLSWTERAARYHRAEAPSRPALPAAPLQPTA